MDCNQYSAALREYIKSLSCGSLEQHKSRPSQVPRHLLMKQSQGDSSKAKKFQGPCPGFPPSLPNHQKHLTSTYFGCNRDPSRKPVLNPHVAGRDGVKVFPISGEARTLVKPDSQPTLQAQRRTFYHSQFLLLFLF
jgi:hypothetical protein